MIVDDSTEFILFLKRRIIDHLRILYPAGDLTRIADAIIYIMGYEECVARPEPHSNLWDQSDVIAITYADTMQKEGEQPLHTLHDFANEHLRDIVSILHILPFYPYSSDAGFAVKDYTRVNPIHGEWEDVVAISKDFRIMADLVINHCSSEHQWFLNYINDEVPGKGYFIQCSPDTDLSKVVRPRTSPLLRETDTVKGKKYTWCTFSHDQVDLNFENPEVLLEILRIIKHYLDMGVTVFRLDAIAFLWKTIGTECINLLETHEAVRLLRLLIEHVDPRAIIITETNIPNRQNLSYFGNANEAHLVYNFALPPLILYTMLSGNSRHLKTWLMSLPPAQNGTAYFNFIASHDGIGLRPVEGILGDDSIDQIITTMQDFGGDVSWRSLDDGVQRPYELNISLFEAMKGTFNGPDDKQGQRFLCAHAIMLTLEGIPAFYMHSLFATPNDHDKVRATGNKRAINRHQWQLPELLGLLDDENTMNHRVFHCLRTITAIRKRQRAFHPNAIQFMMHFDDSLFAFWRQSNDRHQSIFCIYNITPFERKLGLQDVNLFETDDWHDLVSGHEYTDPREEITLEPYGFVWIANR